MITLSESEIYSLACEALKRKETRGCNNGQAVYYVMKKHRYGNPDNKEAIRNALEALSEQKKKPSLV